ncbi:MAG: long-chain fatty acid--CoA ligase, partial [Deltaproteobacteria bacterium]
PPTVPGMFMYQAAHLSGRTLKVIKRNGAWISITWKEAEEILRRMVLGLLACGISKGDRVGIVSKTRSEWSDADLAILFAGGVTVGIYPTASSTEMGHILQHSDCGLIFIENDRLLEQLIPICREYGLMPKMVLFETTREHLPDGVMRLEEFISIGQELDRREPGQFDVTWRSVTPDDLATIAYTSGTTGPPKGVMITHANLYFTAIHAVMTQDIDDNDFGIAYLPMTHMLQRLTVYAIFHTRMRGVFAESIEKLIDNFQELKPTMLVGVPRIFEKIYTGILQKIAAASPLRQKVFSWAMSIGSRTAPHRMAGKPLPLSLSIRNAVADRLVFRKIRGVFGGRVKYLISGGAPMPMELLEFFYASGLLILEGYGLTETVAPVSVNRPNDFKFGTVGRLIDGIEAKLAEDGELLLRGQGLFCGYYKDQQATVEAIDREGWFHTGDIADIDTEGFIRITDRKKDIIVTAGGKNIAPQNIEMQIKMLPLISQAMVHGDRRNYLTALITLNEAEIRLKNSSMSLRIFHGMSMESIAVHSDIRRIVAEHIATVNARLAPHEAIRRFAILSNDFTETAGELTPTLKIRRREITRRYQSLLDRLYDKEDPFY